VKTRELTLCASVGVDLEASRVFEEVARAVSVRRGSDEKQPSGEKALRDPCRVGFERQSLDQMAVVIHGPAKLCFATLTLADRRHLGDRLEVCAQMCWERDKKVAGVRRAQEESTR
jgi:hypothetical protein